MKKLILFLFSSFCFLPDLSAQLKSKNPVVHYKHLNNSIPDTSNNHLFSKLPRLKSISVSYKNNQPYFVFLNFKNGNNDFDKREHYDLAFEGDAYILEKKYGPIHLVNPKGNIRSIWTNKDSSINFNIVSMLICADTIFYRGIEELPVGTVKRYNPDWIVGMPARYKGDLKLMESRVAEEYAEIEEGTEIDSVVVFEGTVNKRGSLYDVTLIAGKRSTFSDLVQKAFVPPKDEFELLPPREDWFPAGIDRGPTETKIRIYARLNNDGSITIKTPRRLRTFTGD